MLKLLSKDKVVFCELVEHPGGHDGGEFPQYHEYGVRENGTAWYSTDLPDCPNDSFCDDEAEDYAWANTKEEAVQALCEAFKDVGLDPQQEPVAGFVENFKQATSVDFYYGSE